ncbi:hypothetical protein BFS86_19835 [Shewanella algae]|jgi:hypothetical protein|nr:hypothetical protein BFS86_19835 [Shewanella algae]DAQ47173.1 MAG TPA: hypothetical protein [Caudoviricetes sp.]
MGPITWDQIATLVLVIGALGGLWWRLQSQISTNQASADKKLYEFKIHIAEMYITKAGMTEQTDRMMKAIEGLGAKIDRTNERIDQAFVPAKPTRPSR